MNFLWYVKFYVYNNEDALEGKLRHRQKRSEVAWPVIPTDFDEWSPPKKRRTQEK
jgi:hypothetical protein